MFHAQVERWVGTARWVVVCQGGGCGGGGVARVTP
ncbi:hypothetical protein [Streptomyces griseoluteus]